MKKLALVTVFSIAAMLASCAPQQRPRTPDQVIDRALRGAPGQAQPSKIVAAESAFSRAAREQGQWTAFRQFAADSAVIHGRSGPIDAIPWLDQQADPPAAVQWVPLSIWMSCDGRLAVSHGKFAEPSGQWGYFVTVWEQQADRSYKWIYDVGGVDPALTERENQGRDETPLDAGAIVVDAIPMIQGEVADCPARGDKPEVKGITVDALAQSKSAISADGTLQWAWVQHDDGRRQVLAQLWQGGEWREALQFDINPDGMIARR